MKYFSVPADFKKETIDSYLQLNEKYENSRVIETYGNVTLGENLGSGRALDQLPDVDLMDLREYIQYAKANGIDFSYTLNTPFLVNQEFTSEGVARIKRVLSSIYEAGVRSITLSMPSLIELVKHEKYDFRIKASAICHITNANKALAYKKMGMDRIVIDESVHRDFKTLKEIRKVYGPKIELIVNTMCHRNCVYRQFHYNETGGHSTGNANTTGVNFFEHKCILQRYDSLGGLLKLGWIRPEDLKHYTGIGIEYFKLQGRQHVSAGDGHLKTLEYYCKEDYDGGLMELLDMFNPRYSFRVHLDNKKLEGFLKPYLEQDNFCRNNCDQCKHCENFAKKCMDTQKESHTINSAKAFYDEYDQFKELLDNKKPAADTPDSMEDLDADFNMDL